MLTVLELLAHLAFAAEKFWPGKQISLRVQFFPTSLPSSTARPRCSNCRSLDIADSTNFVYPHDVLLSPEGQTTERLMDHTAPPPPSTGISSAAAAPPLGWWQAAVLLLLLGFLYQDILLRLISQWQNDPNFSHGFIVPLFSAYVIWDQRQRLAGIPAHPSWFGLAVIALALATLVVGVLGAELFLSRSSLVLLLGGLVIFFLGSERARALFFPWACLFLMIPIPVIIFNQIAFPLQLFASRLASTLLDWMGVPVLREGNILQLPAMTLEVVEACSGIRSLISLGTLAIVYGYFLEKKFWPRALLALSAIPIAVAANALRVMGTGLLGHWWNPEKAQGFFHTFSGWLLFVLSLVMLLSVHTLYRMMARRRRRSAPLDSRQGAPA